MRRSRRGAKSPDWSKLVAAAPALLVLAILSTPAGQKLFVILIAIGAAAAILLFVAKIHIANQKRESERVLQISDIDAMTGHRFEHFIATLLEDHGFKATVTKGSGDSGVDVVAAKGGIKYAIQCKRSANGISRRAVSDAVAGIAHYHCTDAMVVTNSYFTPGARSLAASNRCMLVDRDLLAAWIRDRQKFNVTLRRGGDA